MELRRLDDYQSWALELGGKRLLIDPWLTEEMSLPPGHWLFGRRRVAPAPVTQWLPVDALVLTAHFSDHLHPATLSMLPKTTPVFASTGAARLVRKLGFTQVTALADGERAQAWDGLELEAIAPGFPYTHNSIGVAFTATGKRLYFETHVVQPERAKARLGKVELLVAPVQSVRLMGIPLVMSPERALEVVKVLAPMKWVPTGNDPAAAHGVFSRTMLFYRGEVGDFRALLQREGATTTLLEPAPGQSVSV
ncbi:MAG: MBL fold metallo-hydrolase [Archangium sp.]|nr:MBL fold metallo-hydrolase [Archangium sp.]